MELYPPKLGTTFKFAGRVNIQFKNSSANQTTNKDRKRLKV